MKTKINPLLLAIPMLCDSGATTLLMIAYINIPASIAQMMGGFVVFIVAILSIIFLKRRFHRHHWSGLVLIFSGICMVATAALIEKGGKTRGNATLGVIMMIASIIVQGCQYIVEEKLLGSYYLSPLKAVGWEGITGVVLFVIILPILQFIPCESEICNNGRVENTKAAFDLIFQSWPLVIFIILNIFMVGGMNGLGMIITKFASAANRVTLSQSKTVIVWVFFLIYRGGGHENFKWLQFAGFIVMLLGVILYNEVIVLPFFGFDKNTKSAIEKRKLGRASLIEGIEGNLEITEDGDTANGAALYTSPKGYDTQRNYQRLGNHLEEKSKASTGENDLLLQHQSQ
jgi:drug/metabolite transporter (DMT)-like permease